jgi:predicted HTH domain antitoxin
MLTIPGEYVQATRMTEEELLLEVAVMLFQKEKLTLGQAARLAGMPQYKFQLLLASRDIPLHYDVEEFREDLETLKRLRS